MPHTPEQLIAEYRHSRKITLNLLSNMSFSVEYIQNGQTGYLSEFSTEGIYGNRAHGSLPAIDAIELAAESAMCDLFGSTTAYVQPTSASIANIGAINAVCNYGDSILSLSPKSGGHATHGADSSIISSIYKFHHYYQNENCDLDIELIKKQALEIKPKLIILGASAFPRPLPIKEFGAIANESNSILMVDASHISGLVVAGLHEKFFPYCKIATASLYKHIAAPRCGIILSSDPAINSEFVHSKTSPYVQGSPDFGRITSLIASAEYAQSKNYRDYATLTVALAHKLRKHLEANEILAHGEKTHTTLFNFPDSISPNRYESICRECNILLSARRLTMQLKDGGLIEKNYARIGTAGLALRPGIDCELGEIAKILAQIARGAEGYGAEIEALCYQYPIDYDKIGLPDNEYKDDTATVSEDAIYAGNIEHLIDSRKTLTRFRTYAITANTLLLAVAAQNSFSGFRFEFLTQNEQKTFVLVLCATAFSLGIILHYLTYIYYKIIDATERDLARMTAGSSSRMWVDKISERYNLFKNRLLFEFGYFGFFWLFHAVSIMLFVVTWSRGS